MADVLATSLRPLTGAARLALHNLLQDKLRLILSVVGIALAVMLYADRDLAPIFGHLSPLAGTEAPASELEP